MELLGAVIWTGAATWGLLAWFKVREAKREQVKARELMQNALQMQQDAITTIANVKLAMTALERARSAITGRQPRKSDA